jgi:YVTN family beta-propeller protein
VVFAPDSLTAYAIDNNGYAYVIDVLAGTKTADIGVGNNPNGLALTSDGATLYVTNVSDNTVSVIDIATQTVTDTVPVGGGPQGVACANGKAYVTNSNDGTVSVISAGVVVATITVGADESTVYIADSETGPSTVWVIDTATDTVTATISSAGTYVNAIAVTPDGSKVYVASGGAATIVVIDTATNTVTGTIALDHGTGTSPAAVAFSPDGSTAFVTGSNAVNTKWFVTAIDVATDTPYVAIPIVGGPNTGGGGPNLSVAPDGSVAYVCNSYSTTIIPIVRLGLFAL